MNVNPASKKLFKLNFFFSNIIVILVHVFLMVLRGGTVTNFVILFHQFSTLNRPFLF